MLDVSLCFLQIIRSIPVLVRRGRIDSSNEWVVVLEAFVACEHRARHAPQNGRVTSKETENQIKRVNWNFLFNISTGLSEVNLEREIFSIIVVLLTKRRTPLYSVGFNILTKSLSKPLSYERNCGDIEQPEVIECCCDLSDVELDCFGYACVERVDIFL